MTKLDPEQIKYIINKMEERGDIKTIGCEMNVSGRILQLYKQYKDTAKIPILGKARTTQTSHHSPDSPGRSDALKRL